MFMWFGLWMFALALEPIKVEAFGTFKSQNFRLYKVGTNFLALTGADSQLTLFNEEGGILAAYKKSGQGPDGLVHPQFLGVDKERLYILSGGRLLLVFDHQLQLLETKTSELPPFISQGILFGEAMSSDTFLLFAFRQDDHLLHTGSLGETLQYSGSFYKRANQLEMRGTYQWLHHNHHFVAETIPSHSDFYSVEVREMPKILTKDPANLLMELVAPVDTFSHSSLRERAILSEMVVTRDGYIVELAALPAKGLKSPEDFGNLEYFWDFFNFNGVNLKRESAGERRFKPVQNSSEVFIVVPQEPDSEVLKPYTIP